MGSGHATGYAGLASFQPQWLLLSESNDWRKRVQVAQRFVHAARVIIYRNRAQARLRQLRALGGELRATPVRVMPSWSLCSNECMALPSSRENILHVWP